MTEPMRILEPYLAEHNRRYALPAAAEADYHRRRPTARQLDQCSGWRKNAWSVQTGGALQKQAAATGAAEVALGAG